MNHLIISWLQKSMFTFSYSCSLLKGPCPCLYLQGVHVYAQYEHTEMFVNVCYSRRLDQSWSELLYSLFHLMFPLLHDCYSTGTGYNYLR